MVLNPDLQQIECRIKRKLNDGLCLLFNDPDGSSIELSMLTPDSLVVCVKQSNIIKLVCSHHSAHSAVVLYST